MSEYKVSTRVPQRVLNYRMSVDSKQDKEYLKLKRSVEVHNSEQLEREKLGLEPHYLRVRGRGRGPLTKGRYSMSVPDTDCTYFDVYVQRDTDAMHRYRTRAAKKKVKGLMKSAVSNIKAAMSSAKPA